MTTKFYRCILIDPEHGTIKAMNSKLGLDEIYKHVGTDKVYQLRIAEFETSFDYGWVDDCGLSRGEPVHAFLFSIRKDPIAGRCLIVGVNAETRDTCDAKFSLDVLRDNITWLGKIKPEVFWEETEIGSRAIVTYSRVQ